LRHQGVGIKGNGGDELVELVCGKGLTTLLLGLGEGLLWIVLGWVCIALLGRWLLLSVLLLSVRLLLGIRLLLILVGRWLALRVLDVVGIGLDVL